MHVNIQSISLSTDANFSWSSGSNAKQHHFEKMINNIKKIDGIDKVTRVYKT
jgi:GTP pyrophosphokinase